MFGMGSSEPFLERMERGWLKPVASSLVRDLSKDWCERGPSIEEAAANFSVEDADWWFAAEDEAWDPDDRRAAVYTWFLTGMRPERRDIPGAGDSRVDLTLHDPDGRVEVVEVLSTLDKHYQADIHRAAGLVRELNPEGPAAISVSVSMGHGWEAPYTRSSAKSDWQAAVKMAHRDLLDGSLRADTVAAIRSVFPALALKEVAEGGPGFFLSSWGARVEGSEGRPYLDRLSDYLATDRQAIRHIEKLRDEAAALKSERTHLYLLVASTGTFGNLLAGTPSFLMEGVFSSPEGLTDLWLDGGVGFIGRWRVGRGWTYHDV